MAKSNLPTYLVSTLTADRNAQLNTIAAIIVYAYAEQKAERTTDDLGARLFKVAPHKSEKTWQNHVSAARAVISNRTQFIDGAYGDNPTQEQAQAAILTYLTAELSKGKYTNAVDDISNWAKGRPSIKAQALAREKAEAAAQKEADANNAKLAAQTPTTAPAETPAEDPVTPDTATKLPSSDANVTDTSATGYPAAITEPAKGPEFMASMARNPEGGINVVLADNLTRADLVAMALALETLLETEFKAAPSDLPVIDANLMPA